MDGNVSGGDQLIAPVVACIRSCPDLSTSLLLFTQLEYFILILVLFSSIRMTINCSKEPDNATKGKSKRCVHHHPSSHFFFFLSFAAAKARGTHLRIHFKHCREIGEAIKGRSLTNAKSYLENVLQFKDAIPFTKYTGGLGRHAVAKKYGVPGDKVGWPLKATRTFLDLLTNVESNAETKGMDIEKVVVTHVNCNQAPKMRRRTYRAHGRINGKLP